MKITKIETIRLCSFGFIFLVVKLVAFVLEFSLLFAINYLFITAYSIRNSHVRSNNYITVFACLDCRCITEYYFIN